jgi:acetylornithine deacetylase/succinyl-diaminopimelate desuccinylase-like protein
MILHAHLDTKPIAHHGGAAAWASDPYALELRDGRAYGLGAADTKGGAAAQLAALARMTAEPGWRGELTWIGAADEENGSRLGTGFLAERGLLDGDVAIVAEPTDSRPSLAQLGNVWLHVRTQGLAGHAGAPWAARDAVAGMLDCLAAMRKLVGGRAEDARFPGHPRVNVGRIEGGAHCGTIAERCSAFVDVRLRPGETRAETAAALTDAAERVAAAAGVQVTVEPYAQGGCGAHEADAEHPLVSAFVAAAGRNGVPAQPLPFTGGTDAYFFGDAGIPAVVFGPGSLRQAHAPDEYVELEQLRRAGETYDRFLTAVLRR